MDMTLLRTSIGFVVHPSDAEGLERAKKIKPGTVLACDVKQRRNVGFHRKFHALCRIAFDYWSETLKPQTYKGEEVLPDYDRFFHDLVIMAGFFTATYALDGSVKLKADSISFASMSQERFEKVYSKVIDVVLAKIMRHLSRDELDAAVEQVMGFVR